MTRRWTFYDPVESNTYQFQVNPNAGGTPAQKKTITTQPTLAPGGKTLCFEGADEPLTFEWSGVLLDESQFNAFRTWYNLRYQIQLTDDLGRQYYIYITGFDFKRERAAHHAFKHTYTAKATLLDWPS